jgi:hypothetical protein
VGSFVFFTATFGFSDAAELAFGIAESLKEFFTFVSFPEATSFFN